MNKRKETVKVGLFVVLHKACKFKYQFESGNFLLSAKKKRVALAIQIYLLCCFPKHNHKIILKSKAESILKQIISKTKLFKAI
jgi:hypothetical protein